MSFIFKRYISNIVLSATITNYRLLLIIPFLPGSFLILMAAAKKGFTKQEQTHRLVLLAFA